jgi:hypothetical protein
MSLIDIPPISLPTGLDQSPEGAFDPDINLKFPGCLKPQSSASLNNTLIFTKSISICHNFAEKNLRALSSHYLSLWDNPIPLFGEGANSLLWPAEK